ncbi:hypothetical protein ACS0TY_032986 [Phlomoides rotata]
MRNSLPLILFSLLIGFGCFLFERAKCRQEAYTNVQVFGAPAPPPGSVAAACPHLRPRKPTSSPIILLMFSTVKRKNFGLCLFI